MKYSNRQKAALLLFCTLFGASGIAAGQGGQKIDTSAGNFAENIIRVEYISYGKASSAPVELPLSNVISSGNIRISEYLNETYQVVIHEIDRGTFTEINGKIENLDEEASCATLRVVFPRSGKNWNSS